jgi:hypothetical protein
MAALTTDAALTSRFRGATAVPRRCTIEGTQVKPNHRSDPEQTRRVEAMTYPPPGGENPQYQLQPEPQQPPSDPYSQGFGSTPPPGNYYQQPPPPQYTQPPGQPMMQPPVGVQPGYPSVPGSVLPPPLPPAKDGGNLGIILGVVVVLVIVLGVAAVLIIPGLVNKEDDPQAGGGSETSEEASAEESEAEPDPTEEESTADDGATGGDEFATWGPAVSSEDYDPNTPEGAAITYMAAANSGDDAALEGAVCSTPTEAMEWDLDWERDGDGEQLDVTFWGVSREVDGETQAWSGYTDSGEAPASQADLDAISTYYFTVVEEEGQWKVCDIWQGW